jgi:PAS domain S-box-containing protein
MNVAGQSAMVPPDESVGEPDTLVAAVTCAVAGLSSDEHFQPLFEQSPLGILMWRRGDAKAIAANPAACMLLQRSEEEIVRVGRSGTTDPTDPRVHALLAEGARTGHAHSELTLLRGDGSTFEAEVFMTSFHDATHGERTCFLFQDISDRKRREHALTVLAEAGRVLGASLEVEATLSDLTRLLVPAFTDICVIDVLEAERLRRVAVACKDPSREPIITAARDYDLRRWGFEGPNAPMGLNPEPLLVPIVDEAWLRAATIDDEHLETTRAIRMSSLLSLPMISHGRVIGRITLASIDGGRAFCSEDVSLSRALADRAAIAIDHARQYGAALEARRLRDEVLGVVSHDLRNPLNAIVLSASLLAREGGDNPALATIRRAAVRADRLIEDLLTITAVERGAASLDRSVQPIASLLDDLLALHGAMAAEKQLTLETRSEAKLEASVDGNRLGQMLGNLVTNAIKFTPEGGRVEVVARAEDGQLVIDVSDTGQGIGPDDLPRLFDRFWQGAHKRRGGAGLGLAIVKGIAEAHGGGVTVTSELGNGTTFTTRWPLMPSPPGVRSTPPAALPAT